MKVVGIGALDDAEAARDFLRRTQVRSFPLLWAADTAAWQPFGVSAQPYTILLVDGEVVERWPGGATPEQVEARVAELA